MVAMKDTHLAKHPEIAVPNLHVMKALQVGFNFLVSTFFFVMLFIVYSTVSEVARLRHGTVCLASLLLVPDQ